MVFILNVSYIWYVTGCFQAIRLLEINGVLQIKSNQIKSNQIKSNQIKSNQIKWSDGFLMEKFNKGN